MKLQDSLVLSASGLAVWIVATLYYAYRGTAVLESGSLPYWINLFVSPVVSVGICIALLRWQHVPLPPGRPGCSCSRSRA